MLRSVQLLKPQQAKNFHGNCSASPPKSDERAFNSRMDERRSDADEKQKTIVDRLFWSKAVNHETLVAGGTRFSDCIHLCFFINCKVYHHC